MSEKFFTQLVTATRLLERRTGFVFPTLAKGL
jgi:hypothetical protein